jgi:hypothetical protein
MVRYEVDGQTYYHVRNWHKHQKVDKPGKPKVPEFIEGSSCVENILESPEKGVDGVAPRARPLQSLSPPGGAGGEPSGSREVPVPLNLVELCADVGVQEQFAKHYRRTTEELDAEIREIVTYWSIGGGAGKCKRNWLQAVRTRLHELGKASKLGEALIRERGGTKPDTTGGYGPIEDWQ